MLVASCQRGCWSTCSTPSGYAPGVCVYVCLVCVCVCSEHGPNLYILVRDVTVVQSVSFGQSMDCPGRNMDQCLELAIHGLSAVPSPSLLLNPRIEQAIHGLPTESRNHTFSIHGLSNFTL